ncbi:saxitoxin and tetrodotoxin-binding protein 1-like [Clupea harengus]|uniref:Saxitoxin and tetrodotoxin-binding protein 1-like n=1 Tax=Clupea harengus TaxID=7950 RepID=A0A6P8H703_CLUHA|nr:saxitoxin and tetrodotoxin-binding protein 1-like [Clupea harengus]
MCVLTTTSTILALLALTQAAPVCEELVKPLHVEDLTPMMGRWWFLSGFCDHQVFTDILKVVNSSWITLTPSGQTGSLIMSQGNMLNGKCVDFTSANMTLKSSVVHVNQMFDGQKVTTEMIILPSGSDYLTLKLKFKMEEITIRSLYLFGRSGKLSDTEQKAFQTQAECLGYSGPAPYTYNGVTELCDQEKEKLICEPLVKTQEIKDVTQFMGRWVFLKGFVDYKQFIDLMKITSSSWMDLEPTSNKEIITINQGNMLNGTCLFSSANSTISNSVLYASEMYEGQRVTSEGWVLPSGTDTLIMRFKSQIGDHNIRALYLYGRSGKASAKDMESFQKQAECLGWIRTAHYTYDGVTELCKKSPDSLGDKVVE